jgi:hypothetical protein
MRSSFCLPKSLSISGRSGGIRKLHTPFPGRDDADRAGLFCPGTRTGVREPVSILSFQQGKNVASISFYEGKNHQNIIVVAPRARVRAVEIWHPSVQIEIGIDIEIEERISIPISIAISIWIPPPWS